ncbi:MAG TPA: HTTM domain-containing protein, partial [Actinomycetota bacterium]|nr:HTTM domain-containing protein [Actinomycetota bacterium]
PWPGSGMKVHFVVLGLLGLMLAAGLFYRLVAVLVFLAISYVFLLEKALYLNHIYLVCLVAFLMIFLPANRIWSLDAWRFRGMRTPVVPAWTLWLLRFQLALPYFFGGIAKLNPDWLRGEPLRMWLAGDSDFPVIGRFFTEEPVVRLMTYGALVLDLFVVPLLLFRRTRPFAYAAAFLFHLLNARLFSIGIFPWLMIAGTAIFFPPDWPRRIYEDLTRRPGSLRSIAWWLGFAAGAAVGWTLPVQFDIPQVVFGGLGGALTLFSLVELYRPMPVPAARGEENFERAQAVDPPAPRRLTRPVSLLLALWVGFHVLMPLRHLVIPGNVHWTEEGHRFSWMMLVRSKRGETQFVVTDASRGNTWTVDPREYLGRHQIGPMQGKPDMVLQFAHYLRDRLHDEGYEDVEIRARTLLQLNGRPAQPFVDPDVDLSKQHWPWLGHADWILPE